MVTPSDRLAVVGALICSVPEEPMLNVVAVLPLGVGGVGWAAAARATPGVNAVNATAAAPIATPHGFRIYPPDEADHQPASFSWAASPPIPIWRLPRVHIQKLIVVMTGTRHGSEFRRTAILVTGRWGIRRLRVVQDTELVIVAE